MNYDPNTGEPINNNKTNGYAIAGFVLAFLQLGILGLIFSIIGLVTSKEYGNGKGFAIAGIVLSILHFILIIAIFVGSIHIGIHAIDWIKDETEKYHIKNCQRAYDCECDDFTKSCRCVYQSIDGNNMFITCTLEELQKEKTLENA